MLRPPLQMKIQAGNCFWKTQTLSTESSISWVTVIDQKRCWALADILLVLFFFSAGIENIFVAWRPCGPHVFLWLECFSGMCEQVHNFCDFFFIFYFFIWRWILCFPNSYYYVVGDIKKQLRWWRPSPVWKRVCYWQPFNHVYYINHILITLS